MGKKKEKYEPVELVLYSNKVSKDEWKQFFTTMLKWKVPGFDFLDFTLLFPFRACEVIFTKKANTIRPFVRGELERIKKLGPLIFPFRASEESKNKEEILSGGVPLGMYVLRDVNILNFLVKERVQQMNIRVVPFLGKLLGFGTLRKEGGGKRLVFLLNPETFMEIDMEKNPSFYMELLDHPLLKSMHMHSDRPLFEVDGIKIGVENFDAFKHTMICGMSGTGKSKFIEMYVKALRHKYPDVRLVLIDPHNELSKLVKGQVVDFKNKHIEPLEIGRDKNPMTTQLIVQLMISVIGEQNKYSERVLFYAIYLLSEINKLTLEDINLLLTDSAKRMEYASIAENDEIKRFFSVEFDDIYMHHFNSAVLPILNFISEYELYIGKKKKVVSLLDMIERDNVTIISFDPHFFGRRMIKFLAGAIIQQMYIFAITHKLEHPTLLLIDEFPVVETMVVKDILSETRKFNLHLCVSLQYLGQIQKEILDSILTNVYNVVSFRLSKSDAGYLSSLMDLKVEEFFKKRISPSELEEEKRNIFINLRVRECVVRMFDGEKYMIPMKVKTVNLQKWRDGTYNGKVVEKQVIREEDASVPFIPYTGEEPEEGAEGKMPRKETELRAEGEQRAGPKYEIYGGEALEEEGEKAPEPFEKFSGHELPPDTEADVQQVVEKGEEIVKEEGALGKPDISGELKPAETQPESEGEEVAEVEEKEPEMKPPEPVEKAEAPVKAEPVAEKSPDVQKLIEMMKKGQEVQRVEGPVEEETGEIEGEEEVAPEPEVKEEEPEDDEPPEEPPPDEPEMEEKKARLAHLRRKIVQMKNKGSKLTVKKKAKKLTKKAVKKRAKVSSKKKIVKKALVKKKKKISSKKSHDKVKKKKGKKKRR